jgi:SAM-dependent methyltransferase
MIPFGIRHLLGLTGQYRELRTLSGQVETTTSRLRGELAPEVVDELAIPSYTHSNPLMRHLFWERLAVALEWVDGLTPTPSVVLDFGCGIGLLFPSLERRGIRIIGCDVHPDAAATGADSFGVSNVQILDAREGLASLADASVGAILVLDVLEHVDDVASLAAEFQRLLPPQGRLLCSLPTENVLYRIGRGLAGFSGAYHVHDPQAALKALGACLEVRRIGRLYSFAPLFDFFEARRVRATSS